MMTRITESELRTGAPYHSDTTVKSKRTQGSCLIFKMLEQSPSLLEARLLKERVLKVVEAEGMFIDNTMLESTPPGGFGLLVTYTKIQSRS